MVSYWENKTYHRMPHIVAFHKQDMTPLIMSFHWRCSNTLEIIISLWLLSIAVNPAGKKHTQTQIQTTSFFFFFLGGLVDDNGYIGVSNYIYQKALAGIMEESIYHKLVGFELAQVQSTTLSDRQYSLPGFFLFSRHTYASLDWSPEWMKDDVTVEKKRNKWGVKKR